MTPIEIEIAFQHCLDFILLEEGGYSNNPDDPGGETNLGISKRAYPNLDIKGLTRETVTPLYRQDYFEKAACSKLPLGVMLLVFDSAVNSGVGRAITWLQRACGADADGVIGPRTLQAVANMDVHVLIARFAAERMYFLATLGSYSHFGRGWTARVMRCVNKATRMA